MAVGAAWIGADRTPPVWDQAHYLWDSLQYVDAFRRDGVGGVIHAFFTVERFYGPGYPFFVFPFMLVLGPSVQSALVANLVLWSVLLLTVAGIANELFGREAGLVAMAVTATIPILWLLVHQPLVDLAAATWACLAVFAMLRSAHFSRWPPAVLAGACAGIGLLTKASVLVFLAGPVLVIGSRAAVRLLEASRDQQLRVVGNMLLALAVALVVAAPWYATNWAITLSYLQSATGGALAAGSGPDNPLDPTAIANFGLGIVNYMSAWLAGGIAAVGIVLLSNRVRLAVLSRSTSAAKRGKRTWGWLLLISWVLLPLGVLLNSHNQDSRYALVIFPASAIVFAGLTKMLRPQVLRIGAIAAVLVAGLAQVAAGQLPSDSPLRNAAQVAVPIGSAGDLALFSPAYAAPDPTADDGMSVMRQLESVAEGRTVSVLVAQEDHLFNINTLTWLAATRHDPFTFVLPGTLTGDPAELDGYDFAIYVPASAVALRNPDNRLLLLNQSTATTVFGDQLFNFFARSRHQVAIEGGKAWVLER